MAELEETLGGLAAKARRLLAKNGDVGEENTKAVLVEPLLEALGWDTRDLEEVQREFRYKPQDNPVDYALLVSGKPRLFVEAKGLGRDLGQHKWKTQAVNYANTAGVEWCVLTDGNFWQVYKSNAPGDLEQKLFLETWLHSPEGRTPPYEPQYVLSLLARDKLAENEIETLWQVLNVDRRGREALLDMMETKNQSLVRLVRKWTGLTRKEVEAFLTRAEVSIETPPVSVGGTQAVHRPRLPKRAQMAGGEPGLLWVRGKGVAARGRQTADGFVVLRGSQAVADAAPHLEGSPLRLRKELIEEGVLARAGEHLEFQRDHTFRSPSAAAGVVLGRSAAGPKEWQDEQRRSLKQLQEARAAGGTGEHVDRTQPLGVEGPAPRRARRGREPRVPGLPTQRQLEVPLLRAILKRGGVVQVRAQGREVDEELADEFGLTDMQRRTTFPDRPGSVWSNRIRWTRMALVQKGDLDGSQRGVWRVTEQGRRRAEQA